MKDFIAEYLTNGESLSLTLIVLNNVMALIAAFFLMFTYRITYAGTAYSRKFNISLGSITITTTMIMSVISNNVALSLGMVGALSIIRFRTAVKDVRDSAFIFWAIAVGIGCGVSQYALIGIGSAFLLVYFVVTRAISSSSQMLVVVEARPQAQSRIEAAVDNYCDGKQYLSATSVTPNHYEGIYRVSDQVLKKGEEKNVIGIAAKLLQIEGVERVNVIEQQDDFSR